VNVYDDCGFKFSDGLWYFALDEKKGFMDKTGKIIIDPAFDEVSDFQNGMQVQLWRRMGLMGIIDKKGELDS
jgi:hypothetical protein